MVELWLRVMQLDVKHSKHIPESYGCPHRKLVHPCAYGHMTCNEVYTVKRLSFIDKSKIIVSRMWRKVLFYMKLLTD